MTEREGVPIRDVTSQIGYLLKLAQSNVWRDLVATFAPYGIRPQQYAAMARLEATPGITLEAVAQTLGMRAPNLVAMIEDLVIRGLVVKRKRAYDRRASFLELTADGAALLQALKRADDIHEQAVTAALGNGRLTELAEDLKRLAAFSSAAGQGVSRKRA